MPKGIPLTEEELEHRRHEIFNTAVKLFAEKGFNETSMREIAEAAQVGKSTLYDYFSSKDEMLIAYVVDEVGHSTVTAKEIIALDLSVGEKIHRILRSQLDFILSNKKLYLYLIFEVQRLSRESQQRIQVHRYAYQDMVCRLLEEGIRNGEFRPVNPLLAVRGMFTMLTSAVFTSRPTGTPEEMLQDIIDIFFRGLEA